MAKGGPAPYFNQLVPFTTPGRLVNDIFWRQWLENLNTQAIALIDLATDVTGVLPIANGGTSATTANAAFAALSPMTTRGDLITRNALAPVRLAIGANTTVLTSDGTDASWQPNPSGDVVGPGSSTDNAIARFDGTTGKLLQNTATLLVSDAGAITFADGVRQTFNPDATNAGINVGAVAGDPASPSNGDLWYDSGANELTGRINGANVALGGGLNQLTGDVTAGPGSGSQVATIANNAVSNAKLRDSAATSVIGRSANSTGDPADIAGSTQNQILAYRSAALAFTAITALGYWSPLTNGDPVSPELIFDGNGDTVDVWTAT